MALIELHPDLAKVIDRLERIATALETIVREQYHISLAPVKVDKGGEEPDVSYSDDLTTLRHELIEMSKGAAPDGVEDE